MELEHYLGIGCIVIILVAIIYSKSKHKSLKDIYKEMDNEAS